MNKKLYFINPQLNYVQYSVLKSFKKKIDIN